MYKSISETAEYGGLKNGTRLLMVCEKILKKF